MPNAGTVSGNQAICSNGTTTFTTNGDAGGTWSTSYAGTANVNSTTGVITGAGAGTVTITYLVSGTGGCSNATATRTVTVTQFPNAGSVAGTQVICPSGSTVFFSNGDAGGAWTSGNTSVATVNVSSGAITPVASGSAVITYTVTGTGGCGNATATRTLTISATSTSTTNISICPGASYTFNGTTYNTAGTYTYHTTNTKTCDSAATLILTVKATSTSTTNLSICPSALPYLWNGLTFNAAGTQTVHLTNSVGCDSAATLVLAVKATSTSTTNLSICPSALPYLSLIHISEPTRPY